MNPRQQFRALMSELRSAARRSPLPEYGISRAFVANGIHFTVTARNRHSGQTNCRTSRLSERPRRALQCDALQWAAYYRRAVKASPMARARNLEAARACIREAAAYSSAFNRLP